VSYTVDGVTHRIALSSENSASITVGSLKLWLGVEALQGWPLDATVLNIRGGERFVTA
jgi:hypothetical protein